MDSISEYHWPLPRYGVTCKRWLVWLARAFASEGLLRRRRVHYSTAAASIFGILPQGYRHSGWTIPKELGFWFLFADESWSWYDTSLHTRGHIFTCLWMMVLDSYFWGIISALGSRHIHGAKAENVNKTQAHLTTHSGVRAFPGSMALHSNRNSNTVWTGY